MLYQEIKRRVLEHLNRYSIAGEVVSPAYNGQSDDLQRIPNLINDAVMGIRTTVQPITAHFYPQSEEKEHGLMKCPLPTDFRMLKGSGVWHAEKGDSLNPFRGKMLLDDKHLYLPEGEYMVEYYRYPELLPEDPGDEYEYGESREVLLAAACYAAANLAMLDDEFVYSALMQEYERRLLRMTTPPWDTVKSVTDVYGFMGGEV